MAMLKFASGVAGLALILASLSLGVLQGVLAAFLVAAVFTDTAHRTIPNRLVYPGLAVALLCQAGLPSGQGLWAALQGMGIGFALFLPLYLLRAMGAGDVKLLAMVGAFTGPTMIFGITLAILVAGGIMAIIAVLIKHQTRQLSDNLRYMFTGSMIKAATGKLPIPDAPAVSAGKLPYAAAIASGTLGYLFWSHYMGAK